MQCYELYVTGADAAEAKRALSDLFAKHEMPYIIKEADGNRSLSLRQRTKGGDPLTHRRCRNEIGKPHHFESKWEAAQ